MGTSYGGTRIWSPTRDDIDGVVGDSIVQCLAAAFGSGVWASSPMPVGDETNPHSARGIVASLSRQEKIVVASRAEEEGESIIGCVLGGVLDDELIVDYRLAPFGAKEGDGLLAYIGVAPNFQGSRLLASSEGGFATRIKACGTVANDSGASLSSLLFKCWLNLPTVTACPSVFVRTRKVLKPIVHLAEKNGFQYEGKFYLDFNGEQQDRIVFRRSHQRVLH
jgi:hypothetical protein